MLSFFCYCFVFKEIPLLLCIFPVPYHIPVKREGGFPFSLSPLWDLVSVDFLILVFLRSVR